MDRDGGTLKTRHTWSTLLAGAAETNQGDGGSSAAAGAGESASAADSRPPRCDGLWPAGAAAPPSVRLRPPALAVHSAAAGLAGSVAGGRALAGSPDAPWVVAATASSGAGWSPCGRPTGGRELNSTPGFPPRSCRQKAPRMWRTSAPRTPYSFKSRSIFADSLSSPLVPPPLRSHLLEESSLSGVLRVAGERELLVLDESWGGKVVPNTNSAVGETSESVSWFGYVWDTILSQGSLRCVGCSDLFAFGSDVK